jgi:hypothetical protein
VTDGWIAFFKTSAVVESGYLQNRKGPVKKQTIYTILVTCAGSMVEYVS